MQKSPGIANFVIMPSPGGRWRGEAVTDEGKGGNYLGIPNRIPPPLRGPPPFNKGGCCYAPIGPLVKGGWHRRKAMTGGFLRNNAQPFGVPLIRPFGAPSPRGRLTHSIVLTPVTSRIHFPDRRRAMPMEHLMICSRGKARYTQNTGSFITRPQMAA